jgi:diguanylate cyclase (GGDEF)-like protein
MDPSVRPSRRCRSARMTAGMLLPILSGFSASAAPVYAPENVGWRFWTASEGLTEAYTTSVSSLPGGRIAVRHGDVTSLDILDGFSVKAIPDRHWLGRVYEDSEGTLYTYNDRGIATFQNGSWTTSAIPELDAVSALKKFAFRNWFTYPTRRLPVAADSAGVVPVGAGRALILAPGRILEWKRGAGTRVIRRVDQTSLGEFLNLQQAGSGSAWLMGRAGFARITLTNSERSLYEWTEVHPDVPGLSSFTQPVAQGDGTIFVTAQNGGGVHVALIVDGNRSSVVATASGLGGMLWPGAEGRIWKTDGKTLGYVEGGRDYQLPASPELAGQIMDILPERNGGFWMATSQKLAHYTPPLWREPAGGPRLETLVNSMAEDASGRIWFSSGQKLLVNDHGLWHEYSLPAGEEYRLADPKGLSALSDGTVLLDVDAEDHRLIFDPRTARFHKFTRGPGRLLGPVMPRRAGGLWVGSYASASRSMRIEILENGLYRAVPGLEQVPMSEVRDVLEARSGDIWIGATGYLARLHRGYLRVLTPADGFADSGAYAFAEAADGAIYIGGRKGVTIWDGTRFSPVRTDVDRARSFAQSRDGAFWVASGTGVFRFEHGEWIGHSTEEGLPGAGYKVFCDSTGRLWAGTTFGLRVYHPESDPDAPETGISEERNLRKTAPGGDVRLNFWGADEWNITETGRLLFSYALDNGTWSRFEPDTFASFKSLSAGHHIFYVRAMDRNGNIDRRPVSFEFSVPRPLYREPVLLFLLLIAIVATGALIRAAIERHNRLRFESRHDPLTRLLNRAAFEVALDQAVASAADDGDLAVMFLDLDGFKSVNDTLGHRFGDLLLIALSARIGSCLRLQPRNGRTGSSRQNPSLARIGGDEFAIILPGVGALLAQSIAARILESVRGCTSIEDHAVNISCSIGISLFPEHGGDATTLLRLADLAMYRGKAGSKNCCHVFNPEMNTIDFRQSGIAVLLREALDNDFLFLVYQPIQDASGAIVEVEALARIAHPERGLILPGDFIPVAEETGLIVPLGKWVLREALRQARDWQDRDLPVRVAVNVSPVQLSDPAFADMVFGCIDEAGVPPMALAIEITESALARNWDVVAPQIQRLRAAGVSISLDDFGTGYSSLSRLHKLPVDRVKIDRSFVAGLADRRSSALIRDTIALAHRLGYLVVGEGVESVQQIDDLRAMECDHYQGYLLSRPVHWKEATRMLSAAKGSGCSLSDHALSTHALSTHGSQELTVGAGFPQLIE